MYYLGRGRDKKEVSAKINLFVCDFRIRSNCFFLFFFYLLYIFIRLALSTKKKNSIIQRPIRFSKVQSAPLRDKFAGLMLSNSSKKIIQLFNCKMDNYEFVNSWEKYTYHWYVIRPQSEAYDGCNKMSHPNPAWLFQRFSLRVIWHCRGNRLLVRIFPLDSFVRSIELGDIHKNGRFKTEICRNSGSKYTLETTFSLLILA